MTNALTEMVFTAKVAIRQLETFGRMKLWDVEHFPTDFDLRKRRDNKMGTYKTLQLETNNKISGKKRTNIFKKNLP